MSKYVTAESFRDLYGLMPQSDFDELSRKAGPPWISTQIEVACGTVDGPLAKRYDTPFVAPAPIKVCSWVSILVLPVFYWRLGISNQDVVTESGPVSIETLVKTANDEIQAAADAQNGLFELPLRRNTSGNGIVHGSPRGYSESSPYDWIHRQGRASLR